MFELNTEQAFHTRCTSYVVPEFLVLREDTAIFDTTLLELSERARRIVGDQMPNSPTAVHEYKSKYAGTRTRTYGHPIRIGIVI